MAHSTRKVSNARRSRSASPYSLVDYHTGEDGENREAAAWGEDYRTILAAAKHYFRQRGGALRSMLDDIGTLKGSLAYQVEEMAVVMNRTTRSVAATITCDWRGDDLWGTIVNHETGQVVQQIVVIPLTSPFRRSA